MGMSGNFKGDKPPKKLISGLYHQGSDYDLETGERIDGICKYCNEWDAELIEGGCRDRECKDKRMRKMVESGQAISIQTGFLDENGKACTVIERAGKRTIFERQDDEE